MTKTMILHKFRSNFSSFRDIWIFNQIFFLVVVLPVLLKFLSLPLLMKTLTSGCANLSMLNAEGKIVKYTDYIYSRTFWIFRRTCLKRSLVLYHFLRKYGIEVQLCFGVRYADRSMPKVQKKLEGHAWLTYKGGIYLEQNAAAAKSYKVTYRFPTQGGAGSQTTQSVL